MADTTWPSRPTPKLIAALRRGKAALRHERQMLSLQEKVRAVIELQRSTSLIRVLSVSYPPEFPPKQPLPKIPLEQ